MPGKHILVVDDEIMVLDAVRMTLAHFGHLVATATDPAEALKRFSKESFDLVITDLKMPGMSGAQLACEVKRLAPTMPIVLLTGHAPDITPASVDAVLLKPFSTLDLRTVVTRLTEARS